MKKVGFWTEYWFPVKDIGGIKEASKNGAMNIEREGGYCGIFVFIRTDPKNTDKLAEKGILVRKCDDGIRVTLGPRNEMEKFIAVFRDL